MSKIENLLGSIFAFLYFIFPMTGILLLFMFYPIMFLTEVSAIRESGFAGANSMIILIPFCAIGISLSIYIPSLNKMYTVLPWLYPLIKVMFMNFVILAVAILILNFGYEVSDPNRHQLFFILMLIQILVSRLAMSYYFRIRSV